MEIKKILIFTFIIRKNVIKNEQLFSSVICAPYHGLADGLTSQAANKGIGLPAPSPAWHELGVLCMFLGLK